MRFWKAARRLVEPGGILVFAVCSLEREEGEEQIAAFLDAHPEFSRAPVTADEVFGHGEWITPDGDLRTLPCHLSDKGGMDGFYAARLKRALINGSAPDQIDGGENRRHRRAGNLERDNGQKSRDDPDAVCEVPGWNVPNSWGWVIAQPVFRRASIKQRRRYLRKAR